MFDKFNGEKFPLFIIFYIFHRRILFYFRGGAVGGFSPFS